MKKIAYICDLCKKAYYTLEDIDQIEKTLYKCKDSFECKGRVLRQNKTGKYLKGLR